MELATAEFHVSLASALPYLSSLATAVVAIIAIVTGRRSSKDALQNELKQRMWEKRTDTYIDILHKTQSIDPRETPPQLLTEQASSGDEVPILPILDTAEWLEFSARVDAVASDEVRSLFSLWERCLSGWTWILAKAIAHLDPTSEFHEKAKGELDKTYDAVFTARALLTQQIRHELRFETVSFPAIKYVAPEAFFGAITELTTDESPGVRQSPRMISYKRDDQGDRWQIQL